MQELEKILEEIIEQLKEEGCIIDDASENRAEEIIRKHMKTNETFEFDFSGVQSFDCQCGRHYVNTGVENNDGWIPVEERLPDNNEDVLVTTDVGLITFGYVSHGKWITDQEPDYPIAWRPLPESYRPERSDNNDGE